MKTRAELPSAARVSRIRGLSLLEVLIAMLILTIGATSLLALFATASSSHRRAVDRTNAALIAEEIFSVVESRYSVDSDLDDLRREIEEALPATINGYGWEVALYRPGEVRRRGRAPLDDDPGDWGEEELVVRVAVKWSTAAQAREEVYATILLPRIAVER